MATSAKRQKILIVDDTPPNIRILGQALQRDYDVLVATNGSAGLALAASERPDLVLLDIMMPEMDGYEVCAALKANPALASIPVIFITAMAQEEDEARGLAAGAVDYIRKPFSVPVAHARIRLHLTLKAALRALEQTSRKNKEELEDLAALQERLLPREDLHVSGLDIKSLYRPSGMASGDYFDYFKMAKETVRVVIADVAGHGARAAFVMGIVRSLFRQSRVEGRGLGPTINMINKHLVETIGQETDFVTLFAADLHLDRGELEYVNSAHCPAFLRSSNEVRMLKPNSRLLGFFDEEYLSVTIHPAPPFRLLLYTDGFFEWKTTTGEIFSFDRFAELALEAMKAPDFSLEQLETLLSAEHLGPIPFRDDLTALYIDRSLLPKPEEEPLAQGRPKLLVIDDATATVKVLSQEFRHDHEIFVATTGEAGLTIARRERPDLILLDIVMPGMDGYAVIRQLKEDPSTRHVPVVFMSEKGEEEDVLQGLKLGAIDYVTKPFNLPILRTRLKNHLELKDKTDQLERLAALDGLTGIPNRRAFDEKIDHEWRAAIRSGTSLGMIMIDIDYFKRYNETYGHMAGDECLRCIAQTLKRSLRRPKDMVARFGNEEFALLLPDTDLQGSVRVAETIRQAIADLVLPHEQSRIAEIITVSLGVAAVPPARDGESRSLVQAADRNLYRAKEAGRNRVVAAED